VATYSAWDWDLNQFRVYRDQRPASIGDDPVPPRPKNISPIGAVPDKDVKLLPDGARQVGVSLVAVGEIVRDPRIKNTASSGGGGGDGLGSLLSSDRFPFGPLLLVSAAIAAAVYLSPQRSR